MTCSTKFGKCLKKPDDKTIEHPLLTKPRNLVLQIMPRMPIDISTNNEIYPGPTKMVFTLQDYTGKVARLINAAVN